MLTVSTIPRDAAIAPLLNRADWFLVALALNVVAITHRTQGLLTRRLGVTAIRIHIPASVARVQDLLEHFRIRHRARRHRVGTDKPPPSIGVGVQLVTVVALA